MKQTVIDIAVKMLEDKSSPLPSKTIAEEALKQHLISSKAKNPKQSLANAIDKMIREKSTDKLIHVLINNQKYVALPTWEDTKNFSLDYSQPKNEFRVSVDSTIKKIIELLIMTEIAQNEKEATKMLIDQGREKTKNLIVEAIQKLS